MTQLNTLPRFHFHRRSGTSTDNLQLKKNDLVVYIAEEMCFQEENLKLNEWKVSWLQGSD